MNNDIEKYKELKKLEDFQLGELITEEGVNIKKAHYTKNLEIEFQLNNKNYIKAAIHATSNRPKILTDSQLSTSAMQSLMLYNAENPASIFTSGNYEFKKIGTIIKYVPS
jgi:hypothetical protein